MTDPKPACAACGAVYASRNCGVEDAAGMAFCMGVACAIGAGLHSDPFWLCAEHGYTLRTFLEGLGIPFGIVCHDADSEAN